VESCKELEDLKGSLSRIKGDIDFLMLRVDERAIVGNKTTTPKLFLEFIHELFNDVRKEIDNREQILIDYYEILATYEEDEDAKG